MNCPRRLRRHLAFARRPNSSVITSGRTKHERPNARLGGVNLSHRADNTRQTNASRSPETHLASKTGYRLTIFPAICTAATPASSRGTGRSLFKRTKNVITARFVRKIAAAQPRVSDLLTIRAPSAPHPPPAIQIVTITRNLKRGTLKTVSN